MLADFKDLYQSPAGLCGTIEAAHLHRKLCEFDARWTLFMETLSDLAAPSSPMSGNILE